MSQARARRFSPIFSATVIPDTVEPLVSATGEDYTRMSATLRRAGKPDMHRVVMAFGKPNRSVRHLLTPGQPVELAKSEEHTSELQSLMRISYAAFCLKKKKLKIRLPYILYQLITTHIILLQPLQPDHLA